MIHRPFHRLGFWTAIVSAGLAVSGADVQAEEPQFVVEQTQALVDATEHRELEIVGIEGTITVRAGMPDDLRFTARSLANRREERALALWADGRTLILTAGEGLEGERLLAEIIVPPHMATVIEASSSRIHAVGLNGSLEARGDDLTFDGRGLVGAVDLEVRGGGVTIRGAEAEVTVSARDADVVIHQAQGFVTLTQVGGTAKLSELEADALLDLEDTELVAEVIKGSLDLTANGGDVQVSGLHQGGGELSLGATPLRLSTIQGPTRVQTEGSVDFHDLKGAVRIESFGGGLIRGVGAQGELVLNGRDFTVQAEQIAAALVIEGDELRIALKQQTGDVNVAARGSEISIEGVDGKVVIQNDFGDVQIVKATKAVQVTCSEGIVRVTELGAPLQLRADGPEVTVQWTEVAREADSYIENKGGNVVLMFSPKSGGRIEATARNGKIESTIDGVEVVADGKSATGFVNRLTRPKIQVLSGGNIRLMRQAAQPPGG